MRIILYSLAVGLLLTGVAIASDCGPAATCGDAPSCGPRKACGSCGSPCRVVCDTKKVKKTVWVVECEEFCAPLPNCPLSAGCGKVGCCSSAPCGEKGCSPEGCGGCKSDCFVSTGLAQNRGPAKQQSPHW